MDSADQKHAFLRKLHAFLRERGEDTDPPSFAKRAVDQFKLWTLVQEAGGHAEVTVSKGWARIGRMFDPPKTMTDLSFRIKKIYETNLLPFEKAVLDGGVQDVYIPPRVSQPASNGPSVKAARPGRAPKRAGSGGARSGPKRIRQAADSTMDEMVGKRIRVLWPEERQFFSGTVTAFDPSEGMHRIDYDDGDEEMLDLSAQTWHLVPELSPERMDHPNALQLFDNGGLGQLHSAAEALANANQASIGQENAGTYPHHQPESELNGGSGQTSGKAGPSDDGCILQGEGYKVYETENPAGFEIFCLIPGLQLEEIRVQCWDIGKLLVTREVKDAKASAPWGVRPLKHKIRLPKPVKANSARALVTLHGQLYIKVFSGEASAEPEELLQQGQKEQHTPDNAPVQQSVEAEPGISIQQQSPTEQQQSGSNPEPKASAPHQTEPEKGQKTDASAASVQQEGLISEQAAKPEAIMLNAAAEQAAEESPQDAQYAASVSEPTLFQKLASSFAAGQ